MPTSYDIITVAMTALITSIVVGCPAYWRGWLAGERETLADLGLGDAGPTVFPDSSESEVGSMFWHGGNGGANGAHIDPMDEAEAEMHSAYLGRASKPSGTNVGSAAETQSVPMGGLAMIEQEFDRLAHDAVTPMQRAMAKQIMEYDPNARPVVNGVEIERETQSVSQEPSGFPANEWVAANSIRTEVIPLADFTPLPKEVERVPMAAIETRRVLEDSGVQAALKAAGFGPGDGQNDSYPQLVTGAQAMGVADTEEMFSLAQNREVVPAGGGVLHTMPHKQRSPLEATQDYHANRDRGQA